MLTSVYYYEYYKPYILNGSPKLTDGKHKPKSSGLPPEKRETFVLNNSHKRDIIRYATGLSGTVNSLRDSSKNVLYDIFKFKREVAENGYEHAKSELLDDLRYFTDSYNRNLRFTHKDAESRQQQIFVDDLAYDVKISTTALSKYGITVAQDDSMSFDGDFFEKLSGREMSMANRQNHALFKHVYDAAGEFLTMPLSTHLNFKNLGYFYNYKLGTMEKDSFKLIQSGMIVDKIV